MPFDYLQKRKQPFLDYKNDIILKRGKIGIFSKGSTHGLSENFQVFFKIGRSILFEFVLKKKHPFLDYKNDITKKSKNLNFFKGVNLWFWSKF